jgi:hypothetical protein
MAREKVAPKDFPIFSFGVVADIQYADKDNGSKLVNLTYLPAFNKTCGPCRND